MDKEAIANLLETKHNNLFKFLKTQDLDQWENGPTGKWTTGQHALHLLQSIRQKGPLVWNFSNFVSMDIAANALLAIGASPAMAHAKEEAGDFSQICKAINGALTINIGTFDPYWQECAREAASKANETGIPWVLDPVGAGASAFRNQNVEELVVHFL